MDIDADTVNLIAELCTRAGMIMEDAVDSALTIRQADAAERRRRLDDLHRAAERMGKLIDAAIALDANGTDA